eukprot:2166934-Pyramimonas_sp.AAC.1
MSAWGGFGSKSWGPCVGGSTDGDLRMGRDPRADVHCLRHLVLRTPCLRTTIFETPTACPRNSVFRAHPRALAS